MPGANPCCSWPGARTSCSRTRAGPGGGPGAGAAGGEPWDGVVAACVARGLAGVEALSGIPGSTGATPIQNVGAYGQEVSQTLRAVTVWDRPPAGRTGLQA